MQHVMKKVMKMFVEFKCITLKSVQLKAFSADFDDILAANFRQVQKNSAKHKYLFSKQIHKDLSQCKVTISDEVQTTL